MFPVLLDMSNLKRLVSYSSISNSAQNSHVFSAVVSLKFYLIYISKLEIPTMIIWPRVFTETPAIAGVKMYYLRNAMRSSNVPSWRNNRYAAHGFISFFKNTNPWNFSCRCSETSDNSHNVRFWQLNNVSTWPWEVPGVWTATFNTSVVAPSSLLNWLIARTVVTISSSISTK